MEMDIAIISANALVLAACAIGAAIAVLAGSFTALGQGNVAAKACEAVGRQPEAKGAIMPLMILGSGMAETAGVYGLVISLLLMFVAPGMLVGLIT